MIRGWTVKGVVYSFSLFTRGDKDRGIFMRWWLAARGVLRAGEFMLPVVKRSEWAV